MVHLLWSPLARRWSAARHFAFTNCHNPHSLLVSISTTAASILSRCSGKNSNIVSPHTLNVITIFHWQCQAWFVLTVIPVFHHKIKSIARPTVLTHFGGRTLTCRIRINHFLCFRVKFSSNGRSFITRVKAVAIRTAQIVGSITHVTVHHIGTARNDGIAKQIEANLLDTWQGIGTGIAWIRAIHCFFRKGNASILCTARIGSSTIHCFNGPPRKKDKSNYRANPRKIHHCDCRNRRRVESELHDSLQSNATC